MDAQLKISFSINFSRYIIEILSAERKDVGAGRNFFPLMYYYFCLILGFLYKSYI